jgi:hypothetical protein
MWIYVARFRRGMKKRRIVRQGQRKLRYYKEVMYKLIIEHFISRYILLILLHKILSISSQNHLWLKRGWHKDDKSWLNHYGTKEDVNLCNNDNIKNSITSKFKDKLWCDKKN